jgi:beta-mannanase
VVEPVFTLDAIIAGQFDADLAAWGQAAKAFGTPLLVEWGTECNGEWFQWNGRWNGRDQTTGFGNPQFADGPERFVAAYRHIVRQLRTAGAHNARFVWHVVPQDVPNEDWNHLERYYPGADAVDWMGVSIYGPLSPTNPEPYAPMSVPLDLVYPRLTALDPTKPIIIAELGCSAGNPQVTPDVYARDALMALFSNRWPAVIGFTWWNERWQNDDNPQNDTIMRVEELPALAAVFRQQLTANAGKLRIQAVTQTGP